MSSIASRFGRAIMPLRPGMAAILSARLGPPTLSVTSAAFDDGGVIPARHTADGAGTSPPLQWSELPVGTASLALLVEDADAPFPRPLVHLVLHAMPPTLRGLAEGAVPASMAHSRMFSAGRNSLGRRGWLAPSPIPGHGPHHYAFQLLALSVPLAPRRVPGRGLVSVTARHSLLGHGVLVGTYERS